MNGTVNADTVAQAFQTIRHHVRHTYLLKSDYLSRRYAANVFVKCENLQLTGSFKIRGAFHKFFSLTAEEKAAGVVAASTGNHGRAVAHVCQQEKCRSLIFAPENAASHKLEFIRSLGGDVRLEGNDSVDAESKARQFAIENSMSYFSPYNDLTVVAGQGTIGVEILEQLPETEVVLVAVGGGGLISGIGTYLKTQKPSCQIFGCSPANSSVMIQSIQHGSVLDVASTPTVSDGTAGGIEHGSITFEICRQIVDRYISLGESEIESNLLEFIEQSGMLIEGAAAVPIAALNHLGNEITGKNIVIVLCGSNISLKKLAELHRRHASH